MMVRDAQRQGIGGRTSCNIRRSNAIHLVVWFGAIYALIIPIWPVALGPSIFTPSGADARLSSKPCAHPSTHPSIYASTRPPIPLAPVTSKFDFCFAENGLTAYQAGVALPSQSLVGYLGEDRLKEIVNWTLHYIADLDIPVKRGTFIEFRNGMLNISPIGRNCSRPERNEFEAFDKGAKVRETMVGKMQELFGEKMGLQFSIGGQISFDVFPKGWDKTYCLKHLEAHAFDEIHFFGDKTFEGGNDYEIFHHPATNGHAVTSPEDTMKQCKELFF